jgi:hypothetical protein
MSGAERRKRRAMRSFYRRNKDEVISRMRHPSSPTKNVAAELILACESEWRLLAEAEHALEVSQRRGQALNALNAVLTSYDVEPDEASAPQRIASSAH